jgi:hypothetical protein
MRITDYMVPYVHQDDIPPEILIAVKTDNIDRVKKAWRHANNPYALARATMYGEAEVIGKPSSVFITTRRGATFYVLKYPSGVIFVDASMVDDDLAEVIQTELLHVTVRRQGNAYVATSIEPLIATPKEERGKELIEVAESDDIANWEIPVLGYGYVTPSTKKLFNNNASDENLFRIAKLINLRFMTTLKVKGQVLHAIELSTPNTGKTTFAVRNSYLLNWSYIDEAPSYAKLIMDARNGALGLVFRSDGIFIDETDKYGKDLRDVVHIMLTGMSHGKWVRGKGDKDAPDIKRIIPVYFAGNKYNKSLIQQNPRSYMFDIISKMLGESTADALLDRIGIVITNDDPINISDYRSNYVIADSYLRGFVAYVSKLASQNYKDLALFSGRRRDQANIVNAICVTLNLKNNCEEMGKEVETGWSI